MPINYLKPECRSESSKPRFGVCDDPPPASNPAYIDENSPVKWIAIVNNPNNHNVYFYAIDNCVDVFRPNGGMESRCDGVLQEGSRLIFIELKKRESGQWLKKGREQLTTTIVLFKQNHNMAEFTSVEAYVCNSLRPNFYSGQAGNMQQFKNDTGYILRGQQIVNI